MDASKEGVVFDHVKEGEGELDTSGLLKGTDIIGGSVFPLASEDHSYGFQKSASGSFYEGSTINNNVRHGAGRQVWKKGSYWNGAIYEGGWKFNMVHGLGTLALSDGRSWSGYWRNGKAIFGCSTSSTKLIPPMTGSNGNANGNTMRVGGRKAANSCDTITGSYFWRDPVIPPTQGALADDASVDSRKGAGICSMAAQKKGFDDDHAMYIIEGLKISTREQFLWKNMQTNTW